MPWTFEIRIHEGDDVRRKEDELIAACQQIFDSFDENYLTQRLCRVTDPVLVAAWHDDELVAFKLAYRRGDTLLYSWLGGVHPDARRMGLAGLLMSKQHDWARKACYSVIETRTRAMNKSMIILNLQHGFVIAGFDLDARAVPVVTQRKFLDVGV